MSEILTPQTLWKDYDETDIELNERTVHSYEEDGVNFSEVYYDGVSGERNTARVFAVTAHVKDEQPEKQPVMLLIDGVNRNTDKELMHFWARQGYLVILPDYCGGNGMRTIYPEELRYCNYAEAGRHYTHVDTSAKDTCWYNWAYCMRRTLAYVQKVYGSSEFYVYGRYEGVRLAMMLLGLDKRIKAGALLFGCLWEDVGKEYIAGEKSEGFDLKSRLEMEEEQERRLAGISPQTYAAMIEVPVYIVQGTNATNADIIKNYEVSFRMKNLFGSTFVYLPRMTQGYGKDVDELIAVWFSSPPPARQPEIKAEVKNGCLKAHVDLMRMDNAENAEIYFSRGNAPQYVRNWIKANDVKMLIDDCFVQIEVTDLDAPVYMFANVTADGQVFSSRIISVVPSRIGVSVTSEPTKLIYKGKFGVAEFVPMDPTKPQTPEFVRNNPVVAAAGAFDVMGIKGRALATFALNDDNVRISPDSALTFDVCSAVQQEMKVYYLTDWGNANSKGYSVSVSLVGGKLWQKVSITQEDFKSLSGTSAQNKETQNKKLLAFVAEEEIILNNILFT